MMFEILTDNELKQVADLSKQLNSILLLAHNRSDQNRFRNEAYVDSVYLASSSISELQKRKKCSK